MIIIRMMGGLGNQMFQFAFARSLALTLNKNIKIDLTLLNAARSNPTFTPRNFDLDIFSVPLEFLDPDGDLNGDSVYYDITERQFPFDKELFETLSNMDGTLLVCGYWQSYKYFDRHRSAVINDFKFKKSLVGRWDDLQTRILNCQSVMINVRRSDYLEKLNYHGVVSVEYLNSAIDIIKNNVEQPVFFVFSDDIGWCRQHIVAENIFFVDESFYDEKYQFYLQLMSSCRHFILSNSSFAWWAAYLSDFNGIVIAPKDWFAVPINTCDLTPDSWLRI